MLRLSPASIWIVACVLTASTFSAHANSVVYNMNATTDGPPLQQKLFQYRRSYLYSIDYSYYHIKTDDGRALATSYISLSEKYISAAVHSEAQQGALATSSLKFDEASLAYLWKLDINGSPTGGNWGVQWLGVTYGPDARWATFTGRWEQGSLYRFMLNVWAEDGAQVTASVHLIAVPTPAAWAGGAALLASLALVRARKLLHTAAGRLGLHRKDDQNLD